MIPAFWRMSAVIALVLLSAAAAPAAFAKKAVAGPLAFEVPDDFTANAGAPPSLHQDSTGITLEVSELPLQALHEFKGHSFLEFLASLGYTNAAYANGALKRTDAHTYVLADAKGKQVGSGRAAIVTAYVPKSQIESGRANIETILSSASVVPAAAAKP